MLLLHPTRLGAVLVVPIEEDKEKVTRQMGREIYSDTKLRST